MPLDLIKIDNRPTPSNCYIIIDHDNENCIIIDPGSENIQECIHFIQSRNVIPAYIILTHEHYDHCWGCNHLNDMFNLSIVCSSNCATAIKSPKLNHSLFFKPPGFSVNNKTILIENYALPIKWNNYTINFFESLGHTNAGICFLIENYLFTGDSLIKDLKTVTKLRSGSKTKLIETMNYIETLKGNHYIVCPGHGDMFDLDTYNLKKSYE